MEEKMDPSDPQKTQFSNVNYWIVGVIALIVVVSIILFSQGKGGKSTTPPQTPSARTSATKEQNVKVFDISAKPFEFSMKEIKVKKGDKVKINLTVTLGMHDWVVDEFNARTQIIQAGQTDSVEFIADKTGTFEYYCSVPTHRQQGMVGKLIVE